MLDQAFEFVEHFCCAVSQGGGGGVCAGGVCGCVCVRVCVCVCAVFIDFFKTSFES